MLPVISQDRKPSSRSESQSVDPSRGKYGKGDSEWVGRQLYARKGRGYSSVTRVIVNDYARLVVFCLRSFVSVRTFPPWHHPVRLLDAAVDSFWFVHCYIGLLRRWRLLRARPLYFRSWGCVLLVLQSSLLHPHLADLVFCCFEQAG